MPIRRNVLVVSQVVVGVSTARKWNSDTGNMTVEVLFTVVDCVCDALVIDIEGSVMGELFFPLASHTLSSYERSGGGAMFHIVDKPVMFIRSNITKLEKTGGGDVTVSITVLSHFD